MKKKRMKASRAIRQWFRIHEWVSDWVNERTSERCKQMSDPTSEWPGRLTSRFHKGLNHCVLYTNNVNNRNGWGYATQCGRKSVIGNLKMVEKSSFALTTCLYPLPWTLEDSAGFRRFRRVESSWRYFIKKPAGKTPLNRVETSRTITTPVHLKLLSIGFIVIPQFDFSFFFLRHEKVFVVYIRVIKRQPWRYEVAIKWVENKDWMIDDASMNIKTIQWRYTKAWVVIWPSRPIGSS